MRVPSRALVSCLAILGFALAACGGTATPEAAGTGAAGSGDAAPVPAVTSPPSAADAVPSVSVGPQQLTASSFAPGDLVPCSVRKVQPLLVLLTAQGRNGVIRGSAYTQVEAGDRVIVRITETNVGGRFEGTLVRVSGKG